MKKGILFAGLLLSLSIVFFGCIKNTPYVTTVNSSMSATIGSYDFVAATTFPGIYSSQVDDTATTLVITGTSSDINYPKDKIQLTVTKFTGVTGTFSIVQGLASAYYLHSGVYFVATGGIVSITQITSNQISGYFSFADTTALSVTNGIFTVGRP